MHDNILHSVGYATGTGRASSDPSPEEVQQYLCSLPNPAVYHYPLELGYYPVLNRLVREWGVRSILEVGVFRGLSACAMIWRNPVVRYVGIDPEEYLAGSLRQAWDNLCKFAGSQDLTFELRRGHSQDVDVSKLGKFDLVYIDGDHSFQAAVKDFEKYWPAVASGGHMVADDALNVECLECNGAIKRFSLDMGLKPEFIPTVNGTAVWSKA